MNISKIQEALDPETPFNLKFFDTISSTNEYLYQLAKKGAPQWTAVVAENQSAGKGRYGRRWESPASKGLYFSLLLRPEIDSRYLNLINLFTAVSLAQTLEELNQSHPGGRLDVKLKWPNDLLIGDKKICGILLESSFSGEQLQFVVIGIGVNVNQEADNFSPDIRKKAASLRMLTSHEWDRERVLGSFLSYFFKNYSVYFPKNIHKIVDLYRKKVAFLGQPIAIRLEHGQARGMLKDISPEGFLVLQQGRKERIITTGEIFGG